jgi:hypothetical protein
VPVTAPVPPPVSMPKKPVLTPAQPPQTEQTEERNVESTHLKPLDNVLIKNVADKDKDTSPEPTVSTIVNQPKTKNSTVNVSSPRPLVKALDATPQNFHPVSQNHTLQTPQRLNNKIVNSRYIDSNLQAANAPTPIEDINTHYHKRNIYKSTHHENLEEVLHRIQQRQVLPSRVSDSALIAPKNDQEGWITSVGIDNPQ